MSTLTGAVVVYHDERPLRIRSGLLLVARKTYGNTMARAKIAISLSDDVLDRLDRLVAAKVLPSRSRAIESAVRETLTRLSRGRLSREAGKLDRDAEQALAEEGLSHDRRAWPAY